MSKLVGANQALQALMVLGVNVDWDKIDGELLQRFLVEKSVEAGGQFERWLIDVVCNRTHQITKIPVPTLVIDCSHPFNPAEFGGVGWGWSIDPSEPEDSALLAIKTLDPAKSLFECMLKYREKTITVGEKVARLSDRPNLIRADAKICQSLLEDWKKNKESSVLWYLYYIRGVDWMDFPGTILLSSGGVRGILCLGWCGDEWDWGIINLTYNCDVHCPSLVFSQSACR